ncbi:MAG TPA: M42 family metallopeptidase [Spirochaetia bacterium]
MKELIKRLTECYGPSGAESGVRELIRKELPHGVETRVDPMGSLIVRKKGSGGRRVMLASHMDEIGICVTHVDQNGFLRFGSVGGVRTLPLLGGRVLFANGTVGVIGLEKTDDPKVPAMEKFYIDVGATSPEDCPVKVGDIACFHRTCEDLGKRIVAKAMDDRVGCAVVIETLKALAKSPHEIVAVFTVQEEVGLRGAMTSAFAVEPDIAIAVDVTLTGDTPECAPMAVKLGGGAAIKIKDGGMLAHPGVKDWLIRTAESAGIPFQREVLTGGTTDAASIQISRAGVPAGCVSIPTRYVHHPSEMVDYGDVEACVRLLTTALSAAIDIGETRGS